MYLDIMASTVVDNWNGLLYLSNKRTLYTAYKTLLSHDLIELKLMPVSYTHLRAHETLRYLVCRLLLEKKK